MSDDWDSTTVIGYKKRTQAKVVRPSGLNGTSPSLSPYTGTDLAFSRKYSHAAPSFTPSHTIYDQALRAGGVATDKKLSAGVNKAHQGTSNLPRVITSNISHLLLGTDHQRIAKLDRENEVAPPAKIAPSVGRVGRA